MQHDFWFRAFQNGVELDSNFGSYRSDLYSPLSDYFKEVMMGGTITAGKYFLLEAETPAAHEETAFSIGDTLITPDYEFTVSNISFSYEVNPSDTSGYHRYYSPDSGKVYLDIDAQVYNTAKRSIQIRDLPSFKADYNSGYTYYSFSIVDVGSSFDWVSSYTAADHLTTCHVHCLIEMPEETETSEAPLFISFTTTDGVAYRCDIR